MGSPKSEENRNDDEVEHQVTISHDFYLGVFEVTQSQYEQVMDVNPSTFQGNRAVDRHPPSGRVIRYLDSSDHPVEKVAWKDAVTFCERLSTLPEEKAAGRVYRLPTEAEWEYACRANSKSTYGFDGTAESLEDYGWFIRNSGNQALDTDELLKQLQNDRKKLAEAVLSEGCRTHKVGEKRPNAWGLYDMHGNVWEWCSDWYGDYPKDAVIDPTGPGIDTDRVKRGGSWFNKPQYCRSAQRNYAPPDDKSPESGFRVLLIVSSQEHTTQPKGRPMSIPDLGD